MTMPSIQMPQSARNPGIVVNGMPEVFHLRQFASALLKKCPHFPFQSYLQNPCGTIFPNGLCLMFPL